MVDKTVNSSEKVKVEEAFGQKFNYGLHTQLMGIILLILRQEHRLYI